jgi:hypothetical protein
MSGAGAVHTRPARTGLFSNVHSLEKRMGNENDEEGETQSNVGNAF